MAKLNFKPKNLNLLKNEAVLCKKPSIHCKSRMNYHTKRKTKRVYWRLCTWQGLCNQQTHIHKFGKEVKP